MKIFKLIWTWIANHTTELLKGLLASAGGFIAFLKPTLPFLLFCLAFILWDCWSAYRLSKRVKKKGKSSGKFKSEKFKKVVITMILAILIVCLAYIAENIVLVMYTDLHLVNYATMLFATWQLLSIAENESSCNDSKIAKVAQKFLVDKTERHFDVDISQLFNDEEKEEDLITNIATKNEKESVTVN